MNRHISKWSTVVCPSSRGGDRAPPSNGSILEGGALSPPGLQGIPNRRSLKDVFPGIRNGWIVFAAGIAFLGLSAPGQAAELRLENSRYALSFAAEGGACTNVFNKTANAPLFPEGKVALFLDCFDRATVEKGVPSDTYRVEAASAGEGRTLMLVTQPASLPGLQVARKITLSEKARPIDVSVTLKNTGASLLQFTHGIKNLHPIASNENNGFWIMATRKNILQIGGAVINRNFNRESAWEPSPVEGWLAGVDMAEKRGVIYLMDRKQVESFCVPPTREGGGWSTGEHRLAPNESVTLAYAMLPVNSLPACVHASDRIVADIQLRKRKQTKLVFTLATSLPDQLSNVRLESKLYLVRSKRVVDLPTVTFEKVSPELQSKEIPLSDPLTEPVVVRVTAHGDGWEESYETLMDEQFNAPVVFGYPYKPEYLRGP